MGKSSKKSATKVDAAPVAVVQSGKKGKRGAENGLEKAVSAKKQKVERDEAVIAKQKVEKKQVKKKAESSSSDDDSDDSDSEIEAKVVVKKTPAPVKNGSAVAKKTKKESSSDSSDSDSDDSDEKPAVKNGSVAAKKTVAEESSESSDSDSEDDVTPAAVVNNGASKDASSSDDDSSDDEEVKKVAAQPKKAVKKPAESSESSDSDDSSSEEEKVAKVAPAAVTKAKVESSDDDSDDSSDDDEEPKASKPKVQAATKSDSSDSEEDSDEDEDQKTPKKKGTDVKMVDAASTFQKTPKAPATPEVTGSKTLFVGNLSFNVEESDVREFFKEAGEVVDVRFSTNPDGQFKGFGHVEFATAEAAQKALEMHEQPLCDRPVRLDLARERGAFTPQSRDNNSFQRGGRSQGPTAFVRGFDTSAGEDDIRSALQEHFGSCGEITRISIPPDHENGGVKGMAYMDFADSNGFNAALGLDGSDLNGGYLSVQEAKPRGDSGGGGRFDRGGRSGGRRGGRDGGGRFGGGGRFSGGRDGGRGGRFSGGRGGRDGGRGGRGAPYRNTTPSGKKTTFGDD